MFKNLFYKLDRFFFDMPISYFELTKFCPLKEIKSRRHYNKAIKIARKLSLLEILNKEQEFYDDKLIELIIVYEEKNSSFN